MLLQFNDVTIILMYLAIILISGFLMTRITKLLKLPDVTGYILAGIVIGPYALNLLNMETIYHMDFVGDIALGFIAFDVGKFLNYEIFMKSGKKAIIITLFESLLAGLMITAVMYYLFKLDLSFSLLLGAIATATAPASTMMTINQYKAKGEFVDTLLQVVAFDDVVCLLAFSLVAAFINANHNGSFEIMDALLPIGLNIAALGLGLIFGKILSLLITKKRTSGEKLILQVGFLLGLTAMCSMFNISPLLASMVYGASYMNLTRDVTLFNQINEFTPPIFALFFILSGMKLDIGALATLGVIGVAYFVIRIIGKYIGAYLGSYVVNMDKDIRNYLGLALVPQAGVAIGLAFLGERMLPPDIGNKLLTIILASSVLYELVGPVSAKLALIYSGAIKKHKLSSPVKVSKISEDL